MATYQGHEWLDKIALPSILGQNFKDWRLYVVNDGRQNEETQRVIEKIADDRILYSEIDKVSYSGGGPVGSGHWNIAGAAAVNEGLRLIQDTDCEFIFHIDQDDFWLPQHINNLLWVLYEKPHTDFAFASATHYVNDRIYGILGNGVDRNRLVHGNYLAHSSIAYRKNSEHDYFYSEDPREPSDYQHIKSFLRSNKDFAHHHEQSVLYFQRCSIDFALGEIKK